MDRRGFLVAAAGLAADRAVAAAPGAADEVVVVGAGIIGASIAYHLAKSGIKVTVLEKHAPASGTTSRSFAYLNAGSKTPRAYYELNLSGLLGWHRLRDEIGDGLRVQWGGAVAWASEAEAARSLETLTRHEQQWGYPARLIDESEFARLLPAVTPGPIAAASFLELEGTLDPVEATKVLLGHAQRYGAKVEFPVAVTGLEMKGGRIRKVRTDHGAISGDAVVLASGNDTPAIAAVAGQSVPLVESHGALAHIDPGPNLLERVVLAPDATIKQNPMGEFVTGETFGGTEAMEATRELGLHLVRNAARFLPALADASLLGVSIGHRVMPKDGFPIVGFSSICPNLYLAAMHSGITLAPIVGQLAAIEIASGASVSPLETFRPTRFG